MLDYLWSRLFKVKPSDGELHRITARATLVLRPPSPPGQPPDTATAFMVSEDLAITAAHCVRHLLNASRQEVDVKGFHPDTPNAELTFRTIPDALPAHDDITALRLVSEKPANLKLGSLKTICFNPCDASQNVRIARKPVYIYGFPVQQNALAQTTLTVSGSGIDGHLDQVQPLIPAIGETKYGQTKTQHTTMKMGIVTGSDEDLSGMSGAPILDKHTGCVIGVQTHQRRDFGRLDGVPLCLLAQHWEPFGKICRLRCRFPWWLGLLPILGILAVAALWQFCCRPPIEITQIPPCGAGPDVMATIGGKTYGADPKTQRVVLFALTDRYYIQPDTDIAASFTDIGADGTWANGTHLGRQYAAILVDYSTYRPPKTTLALPQPGEGVSAITVVDCK